MLHVGKISQQIKLESILPAWGPNLRDVGGRGDGHRLILDFN